MIKIKFNDIYLPTLPSNNNYSYLLLVKTKIQAAPTPRYFYQLCMSNSPFYVKTFEQSDAQIGGVFLCLKEGATYIAYQSLQEATNWQEITVNNTASQGFIQIIEQEQYVWTNNNITNLDNSEIQFYQYDYTIISNAANQPTYTINKTYYEVEIFDIPDFIYCFGNASDNGQITYEWYDLNTRSLVSSSSFISPDTYINKNGVATIGQKKYICFIINTLNETSTMTMTEVITVDIIEPTPYSENNANFTLGQIIGSYIRKQNQDNIFKPLINLDFKNYQSGSSMISNLGTLNTRGIAKINKNNGDSYYENDGFVITNNTTFVTPVNIVCDLNHGLNIGTPFTWLARIKEYEPNDSSCFLCSSDNDYLLIYYLSSIKKFAVALSTVAITSNFDPSISNSLFYYNPKFVSVDESSKLYVFDLKFGDTISITCDTNDLKLYVNENLLMKMNMIFMAYNKTGLRETISNIGFGNLSEIQEAFFKKIKIDKFLYYDTSMDSSSIKKIIDNIDLI